MDEQSARRPPGGPEGLTDAHNTFDERAVLQEFAAAASAGRPGERGARQAERFAERRGRARNQPGEFTTAELVDCERRLIAAAVGRAGEGAGVVDASLAERAIARGRPPLTERAGDGRARDCEHRATG